MLFLIIANIILYHGFSLEIYEYWLSKILLIKIMKSSS